MLIRVNHGINLSYEMHIFSMLFFCPVSSDISTGGCVKHLAKKRINMQLFLKNS